MSRNEFYVAAAVWPLSSPSAELTAGWCRSSSVLMTDRSDRGSPKPRGAERLERDDLIWEANREVDQGRSHAVLREQAVHMDASDRRSSRKPLAPHGPSTLALRPHHHTATPVQGSTSSRHPRCRCRVCGRGQRAQRSLRRSAALVRQHSDRRI